MRRDQSPMRGLSRIINAVKQTTIFLTIYIMLWSLVACSRPVTLPAFATPTAVLAAEVLGETVVTTPVPLTLVPWQSLDGRVQLRVPQTWRIESHSDAGRLLWIWNAPNQRGLISLLLIASPTALESSALQELLLQTVSQLGATNQTDIRSDAQGRMVVEASGSGTNREGRPVPMWLRVSVQQFADSVAIVVMSVPESDLALIQPVADQILATVNVAPLPTLTPIPSATPAPFTKDTFDQDDGKWFEGDDLRRAIAIHDGVYRMYLRMVDSYYLSAPAEIARLDQHISVDMAFEGSARIGTALRFHARPDDTRDYVVCWISPLQRFGCVRSDGDKWQTMYDVTDSTSIKPTEVNHVEFTVQGDQYTFTVNGSVLATFATTMPEPGVPGLYVETFDAAAGGLFDNVETS
ncbi:MAG: hypothetical protein EBS29_06275 [Chloroflexia bacterium]|nr:hypothetical protein [Chloroflexia bacterium]